MEMSLLVCVEVWALQDSLLNTDKNPERLETDQGAPSMSKSMETKTAAM